MLDEVERENDSSELEIRPDPGVPGELKVAFENELARGGRF
jgi:hypothetical protein